MKRIATVTLVVFCSIVIGILFIGNTHTAKTKEVEVNTKVGVIFNGSVQDRSWGQSMFEGLGKTAEELPIDILYRENVPENEQCIPVMEELIKSGCEIILCNSFGYGDYEKYLADKYPEIYFFQNTGLVTGKNFTSFFGRIYQMRYLSGIVAGLQTQTNEIGYVAAMDISEVNRGINAFALGVRSVNPLAKVYVSWSGDWNEDNATEAATRRLLEKHNIDVMAMHTDSQRVLEICEEQGIWSIGYNLDNADLYPNTFLTAPIWHWENLLIPRMEECLQGKFYGRHYWEDSETGVVDLSPLTPNVRVGIAELIQTQKEKLRQGNYDVFYGPIYDSEGNLRVREGENMSDDVLLNDFDWYVWGVEIDE